ncbi:MAG TPA: BamA/TamA family outer membrane protein [Cytophagaceae bacterium]
MIKFLQLFFFAQILFLSDSRAQMLDKVLDFFEIETNEKAAARDSTRYPSKLVLAPIISYAPETNWAIGVGAKFLFKFRGSTKETRTSNMPISALYTLNNQILLYSGYTIFFNEEKYLLKGNLKYSKFPQFYYGIGNNTPETNEELYNYSQILVEPLLLKRLAGKLFAGGGIRYLKVHKVDFPAGGVTDQEQLPGYRGGVSTGAELAVSYDDRDNVLYATKGSLLEFTTGFYGKAAGGQFNYRVYKADLRKYFKVFPNRLDVFAMQLYGYVSEGNVPLAEYARFGGGELMRGYYEGRYRNLVQIAAQVEYRWQLLPRIGFVFFGGVGDVAPSLARFTVNDLKPSFGLGLRFKIVKEENLNIRFDYGFGKKTQNYYLNIAEAF